MIRITSSEFQTDTHNTQARCAQITSDSDTYVLFSFVIICMWQIQLSLIQVYLYNTVVASTHFFPVKILSRPKNAWIKDQSTVFSARSSLFALDVTSVWYLSFEQQTLVL